MGAYVGGGTGSGDTHVSGLISGRKPVATPKAIPAKTMKKSAASKKVGAKSAVAKKVAVANMMNFADAKKAAKKVAPVSAPPDIDTKSPQSTRMKAALGKSMTPRMARMAAAKKAK